MDIVEETKICEPEDVITEAIQNERQKERVKKINRKGENQNRNQKSRVSSLPQGDVKWTNNTY